MAKTQRAASDVDEPFAWPVIDQHLATLNAIGDGLAFLRSQVPTDLNPDAPADILAVEFRPTDDVLRPVGLLVDILVGAVANAHADGARETERSEAIATIHAAIDRARFRVTKGGRAEALGDAALLIRETGLERHDLECILATDRVGKHVIAVATIQAPVAYAALVGRLFERADTFMAADENLALERAASAWFFDCWSDGTLDGDPAYVDFPRMVREQEWSLVSRDTLSLDEPVIASFASDQEPEDVPPRQQRLATAYARSTVGIFEVTAVNGPVATVRDTSGGQTYRYYEHNEEAKPYPGLLILGRLIPLEDDLWLRSPGAVVITSPANEFRDVLATTLTKLCETLPTSIALEGLISKAVFGSTVPVQRLPAPTVDQARDVFVAALDMLDDLGLYGDMAEHQATPEAVAELESSELGLVGLAVDQPVAEWLEALFQQGSVDATRSRGLAAKRKQRKRAKQHGKKRRKR